MATGTRTGAPRHGPKKYLGGDRIVGLVVLREGPIALDELDVVRERVPVLQLLPSKHEVVLIRRDVLLLRHLPLDYPDRVRQLGLDRDGLACGARGERATREAGIRTARWAREGEGGLKDMQLRFGACEC